MYILSVETVAKAGSLALLSDAEILQTKIGDETASHSVNLLTDIADILNAAGVKKSEINLLAAATGPGSFTGLRIGLSTVKGLAKALKIPAVGVSILEAATFGAGRDGLNCAIFPAGRGEVFAQNFVFDENKNVRNATEPWSEELTAVIKKNADFETINWIAPADKLSEIAAAKNNRNWSLTPLPESLANFIGQLAYHKFLENPAKFPTLEPLYVRNADVG